jgi:hypothetical protein
MKIEALRSSSVEFQPGIGHYILEESTIYVKEVL